MPYGHARHAGHAACCRQLATHRVQQCRAPLARTGDTSLLADACHEVCNDHRDDQHDGERHEVLSVANRERVSRWNEEEIEGEHIDDGCNDGGPASEPDPSDRGTQHVSHYDVCELEI